MKYTNRPLVLDAFQLRWGEDVPFWFKTAIKREMIEFKNNFPEFTLINTIGITQDLTYRDYIIKDGNGVIYGINETAFERMFDLVPLEHSEIPYYELLIDIPRLRELVNVRIPIDFSLTFDRMIALAQKETVYIPTDAFDPYGPGGRSMGGYCYCGQLLIGDDESNEGYCRKCGQKFRLERNDEE